MKHELKTWPEFFVAIRSGKKTFEIRKNDRCFAIDDTIVFREWDNYCEMHTGNILVGRVTYILPETVWMLPGFVAFSFVLDGLPQSP